MSLKHPTPVVPMTVFELHWGTAGDPLQTVGFSVPHTLIPACTTISHQRGELRMRAILITTFLILVGLTSALLTFAQDQFPEMSPLTGQFDLTGRTAIDPPPSEPRDTHFRVHLTGESAKALFESMKVETKPQVCGDHPEREEKRLGATLCSTDYRVYECFFAINIEEQTIEGGWAC